MLSKKILFLTTHNLATNPRLVKEIRLALSIGNSVELICFEFDNWSKELNEVLKQQLVGVKILTIPAGRKPFLSWLQSVISERFFRFLSNFISLPSTFLSQAISRRSNLILHSLKKVSTPDLVIGHNPGAIWPSIVAGKIFNCKTGFDVEDYHPGEGDELNLQILTRLLMKRMLPKIDYVSFASPLIMQAVICDLKSSILHSISILNYFPADDFREPYMLNSGPVKLVWFSQNITSGRGLEFILPFVRQEVGNIELHLIGNLNANFHDVALKGIPNIIIHGSMSQNSLHQQLGDFDIGLALEPAKDLNNELAISNKMLAYLQAGLFVFASNTKAQLSYLEHLPGHGICFDYQINDADIVLNRLIAEKVTIRAKKIIRYMNFKNRNWENESLSLLKEWNN
jgi:hypothetical protein